MLWLFFAFLGPISWAVSTHIDKYLVEKYFKNSDTAVLMVFTAIIGLLALPFIWFYEPSVLTLPLLAIGIMTLSGALYMGAMLFYLRAIQGDEASVVAPLFQMSIVWTFLLAYLLLGETLTWYEVAGVVLILLGVLSVSFDSFFDCFRCKTRLLVLMVLSTFVLALSSVIFKLFAIEDTFWATTFWTFVGEALFGAGILVIPRYFREFSALFASHPGAVIGVNAANELINLGGGLAVRYASLFVAVTIVSAISSTTTLFVFAFGILLTLFFPRLGREEIGARDLFQKGIAALLVALGVFLANF